MSTIAKKLKAIADSKEAIRKKLFISPEVPLSAYAELVPGSPAVVKPDQSTFDSALPFGRMKLLEASKEALRVGLGLPVAVPFSAYAEKVAAPAYAADFLAGNFRKNDVEVAFEEVAEFTRLSEAWAYTSKGVSVFSEGQSRQVKDGLLLEASATNKLRSGKFVLKNTEAEAIEYIEHPFTGAGVVVTKVTGGSPYTNFLANSIIPSSDANNFTRLGLVIRALPPLRYIALSNWSGHIVNHSYTSILDIYTGTTLKDSGQTFDLNVRDLGDYWYEISGTAAKNGSYIFVSATVGMDGDSPTNQRTWSAPPPGHVTLLALPHRYEGVDHHLSPVNPKEGVPATRAPDILRVPLPAGHTLTLDADEGIKAERDGDFAVITADKPGYLRRFAVGPVRRSTMDFVKGEYKEGDVKVELSRLAGFTRLSEATDVHGPNLVLYPVGAARVSHKGLLVEPSSTNEISGGIRGWIGSDSSSTYAPSTVPSNIQFDLSATLISSTGGDRSHLYHSSCPLPTENKVITDSMIMFPLASTYAIGIQPSRNYSTSVEVILASGSSSSINQYNTANGFEKIGDLYRVFASGWSKHSRPVFTCYSVNSSPFTPVLLILAPQREFGPLTSYIPTPASTPTTRAPDILRVPVSATQTLTYDADPSISMEMDGTTAVFTATEPGYIRSITLTEK